MAFVLRSSARTRLGALVALATLAAGCSDRKGPTGNDGSDNVPDPTARGTPVGAAVTATIGPAGGSLATADGGLTLTVPAGAVSAPTDFGIEPITNTSPGGVGTGWRLTPQGQEFAEPVELTFAIESDQATAGSSDGMPTLSYQDENGGWWGVVPTWTDVAAARPPGGAAQASGGKTRKSAKTSTKKLTDWTTGWFFDIVPGDVTVKVKESTTFDVIACVKNDYVNALRSGKPVAKGVCSPSIQEWSWRLDGSQTLVNPIKGTLTPVPATSGGVLIGSNTSRANYTAPDQVPSPDFVLIGAKLVGYPYTDYVWALTPAAEVHIKDDCGAPPRGPLAQQSGGTCGIPFHIVATYDRQDQPVAGGYKEARVTDGFQADIVLYPAGLGPMSGIQNTASTLANQRIPSRLTQVCDVTLTGSLELFTADSGSVVRSGTDSAMVSIIGRYKDAPATISTTNVSTGACEVLFSYAGSDGPTGLLFSFSPRDFVQTGDTRTIRPANIDWTFVVTRQ